MSSLFISKFPLCHFSQVSSLPLVHIMETENRSVVLTEDFLRNPLAYRAYLLLTDVNPREGNGTPLQYSCLEKPMDGGAWKAAVHGVAEGRTRLSDFPFTSLSCIGEGNGNPLQCSCLENPRDGGAWWAAVYEVAQSQTRLK